MIATLFALMLAGNASERVVGCQWTEWTGSYGPVYYTELYAGAGVKYSLAEAKRRCLAAKAQGGSGPEANGCQSVTCQKKDSECTLRASNQLQKSRFNEYTYVPNSWRKYTKAFLPGYPSGYNHPSGGYSLAEAMRQCLYLDGCKGVTCEKEDTGCSLRASNNLSTSPSGEFTYGSKKTCPPAPCIRDWSENIGFSAPGYPKGWNPVESNAKGSLGYSFKEAKNRCLRTAGCKAVTCQGERGLLPVQCTLRATNQLQKSAKCWKLKKGGPGNGAQPLPKNEGPCDETTYVVTTWSQHGGYYDGVRDGFYAPGHPAGYDHPANGFSREEARRRCFFYPGCEAVTCNADQAKCTLRASSQLIKSPSNEITFVQENCAVPENWNKN